jgi:LPS-assembly protein
LQPFSDIRAELDLTPGNHVALDADAQWSTYDNIFYGYNAGMHLWDARGDKLSIDYRFSREDIDDGLDLNAVQILERIHSIIGSAQLQLTPQWLLRGTYERDLERRKILEEGVGISYRGQCWGIDLDYKRESSDERVVVLIHLNGLGTIGE